MSPRDIPIRSPIRYQTRYLTSFLRGDKFSRVACETLVTTGVVILAGEVTSEAKPDFQSIVRETIKDIGYTDAAMGFDYKTCAVMVTLDRQSPDISQGVTEGQGEYKEQGAGDQGLMFGYACNHTEEFMPLPIDLSHKLTDKLSQVRKTGKLDFLRPDSKSQVTVRYVDGKPVGVHTVVISSQHSPDVDNKTLREGIIEEVIKPIIPASSSQTTSSIT